MEQTVKQRIIKFCKKKGISRSAFARSIGVSATYVGSIRKSIAYDKQQRISELYPDLNIDWLITGEGEMLRDVQRDEVATPAISVDVLSYLREKDDEIRELRARIDELTIALHEKEIEIVELKKENHPAEKRADAVASSQKVG